MSLLATLPYDFHYSREEQSKNQKPFLVEIFQCGSRRQCGRAMLLSLLDFGQFFGAYIANRIAETPIMWSFTTTQS